MHETDPANPAKRDFAPQDSICVVPVAREHMA